MIKFKDFLQEAWINGIGKGSKESSVVNHQTYNSPTKFKSNAKHVGQVGPLEIHSSESSGGLSHFTYHPGEKKIHHVIHAVEKSQHGSITRLKYLSAHGREGSPVKTGDVYKHLVKHHNVEFVGTGHSVGAQKMWNKFHDDKDLEVHGHHADGTQEKLTKDSKKYADKNSKDSGERRIGKMSLVLRKKQK